MRDAVAGAGLALIVLAACASTEPTPGAPARGAGAPEDRGGEPGGARSTSGAVSVCAGLEEDGDSPPGEARVTRDVDRGARELEAGLELAKRGEHGEALAAFNRAIAADPFMGLAYLEAAECHLYTDGDPQAMRALLGRALDLLPANPRAHLRFADAANELGEADRAEAHWRCALELRPDLIEARKRLGAHLLAKGKIAEAEEQLREASEGAPGDLQIQVALADVLEAANKPLEAAKHAEVAARLAEKSPALYRRAGQLYELAGNPVAARKMRAAADRLDPPEKERKLRPLKKSRR